jgi:hypothetical protein
VCWEINVLAIFFKITAEERARGRKQARTQHFIFSSPLDHDDHPSPLFWWLYLGPQPRYKPSGGSALSPTPLATNRCPLIIGSHHSLLLRKPFSTPARSQLFGATSLMFEAFASLFFLLPLGPAFE